MYQLLLNKQHIHLNNQLITVNICEMKFELTRSQCSIDLIEFILCNHALVNYNVALYFSFFFLALYDLEKKKDLEYALYMYLFPTFLYN